MIIDWKDTMNKIAWPKAIVKGIKVRCSLNVSTGFPIGYNGEIQNRRLKILKIQNSTFVRTTEEKILETIEKIQK